jgi:hypothetical protein
MSADGSQNGGEAPRQRRGSITQAALSNLFQRGPPTGSSGPPFSGQSSTGLTDQQRRRLSVTTLGLSGASANGASALGIRRGSMSTNSNNSDSIDESAIEDDDFSGGPRTAPTTPFVRRMSYGGSAMRTYRPGGSPGNDQQGFNWSDQLRSRAESTVAAGPRPSFSAASSSPPRNGGMHHDRAKSISDMPQPPTQAPVAKPVPQKPDAFQERILKGDFYMD